MVDKGTERERRLIMGYILVALGWFVLSDFILFRLVRDTTWLKILQTLKDGGYVIITGILFYSLLKREFLGRLQARRKLAEERDFANAVVDTSVSLILVTDQEGKIVRVNPAFQDATGYSLNEIWGQRVEDIFVPTDRHEDFRLQLNRLKKDPAPGPQLSQWLTKDGKMIKIIWNLRILRDAQEEPRGIVATGIVPATMRRAGHLAPEAKVALNAA